MRVLLVALIIIDRLAILHRVLPFAMLYSLFACWIYDVTVHLLTCIDVFLQSLIAGLFTVSFRVIRVPVVGSVAPRWPWLLRPVLTNSWRLVARSQLLDWGGGKHFRAYLASIAHLFCSVVVRPGCLCTSNCLLSFSLDVYNDRLILSCNINYLRRCSTCPFGCHRALAYTWVPAIARNQLIIFSLLLRHL